MKTDITQVLVEEHKLILRMIALLEKNATETAAGRYCNWQFYLDGIDFIRNYADRYHHAKEEEVLFKALVHNGMPRENSPVAAMLLEHDQGRAHVRALAAAIQDAQSGKTDASRTIADNALAYASLLREHIFKEDNILYPLSERVLPETVRDGIRRGYGAAEAAVSPDFSERYRAAVARYEQE